MSRPTKSEEFFKKYCVDQGYVVEKIPEGTEKTPDFYVSTSNCRLIAEVKELCPNEDDEQIILEGGGSIVKAFGKRVGEKIKQAKRKKVQLVDALRVIVLYDNIVINDVRATYPNFYMSPADIAFGMYGELKTSILYDKASGKIVGTRNELGNNKNLRADKGGEISAVCVLYEGAENIAPFVYTYHNVFAMHPLPREMFAGPNDKHFRNPISGNTFETSWMEV